MLRERRVRSYYAGFKMLPLQAPTMLRLRQALPLWPLWLVKFFPAPMFLCSGGFSASDQAMCVTPQLAYMHMHLYTEWFQEEVRNYLSPLLFFLLIEKEQMFYTPFQSLKSTSLLLIYPIQAAMELSLHTTARV